MKQLPLKWALKGLYLKLRLEMRVKYLQNRCQRVSSRLFDCNFALVLGRFLRFYRFWRLCLGAIFFTAEYAISTAEKNPEQIIKNINKTR